MNVDWRVLGIVLVLVLPFELNGWYNPLLAQQSATLFWCGDLLGWIGLPAVGFWLLFGRGVLDWRQCGLALPDTQERKRILALAVILSALLHGMLLGADEITPWLFPVNHLETGFSYDDMVPSSGLWRGPTLIYLATTAGVVEEILYRGVLRTQFGNQRADQLAYVVITSLLFASVHWEAGVQGLLTTFAVGLVTALFYLRFNTLYPLIAAHLFVDVLAFS